MKKLLILVMSCNDPFFLKETEMVRETWAGDIMKGMYPNVDFYSYTASTDGKYHIDKTNHQLSVPCDDGFHGTAEKTLKVFHLIEEKMNLEYDYMFRTNASTFVNVSLLYSFVLSLYDNEVIWCHDLMASFIDSGPYPYCLYGLGNGLLFPRRYVKAIADCKNIIAAIEETKRDVKIIDNRDELFKVCMKADDNAMGYILNTYFISRGENHVKHYKSIKGVYYFGEENRDSLDNNNLLILYRSHSEERYSEIELGREIYRKIEKNYDISVLIDKIRDEDIITLFVPQDGTPSVYYLYDREKYLDFLNKYSGIPFLER